MNLNYRDIEQMSWQDFAALDEVSSGQHPTEPEGKSAMWYADGTVSVCVPYDDSGVRCTQDEIDSPEVQAAVDAIWNNQELFEELQKLAIEALKDFMPDELLEVEQIIKEELEDQQEELECSPTIGGDVQIEGEIKALQFILDEIADVSTVDDLILRLEIRKREIREKYNIYDGAVFASAVAHEPRTDEEQIAQTGEIHRKMRDGYELEAIRDNIRWLRKRGSKLDFALNLKLARTAAGLSQAELAERAGIKQNQLSRYERGEQAPSVIVAAEIAEALGIDMNELTRKGRL